MACSTIEGEDATQEADHTEGEPTFAQHEWLWANETDEEFKSYAAQLSVYFGPNEYLADDHPIVQRLQFWIDRMDESLRAAHPEALRATPKPKLVVRKTPVPNAWVSPLPIAWRTKTRALGGKLDAGIDGSGEVPFNQIQLLTNGTASASLPGYARDMKPEVRDSVLRFYNDNFARCRLSYENDAIVLAQSCGSDDIATRTSETFQYFATATRVTITTAYLVTFLDENRAISILAHELGHYYRSHVSIPTDVVNYFYSLDVNEPRKPSPDPRFIDATAKVRDKLRSFTSDYREENALMKERHLGFYTTEQEADEMSLETLAKLGIPPSIAVDAMLDHLKTLGPATPDDLDWGSCAMLRDAGWKDRDGKDASVPVGVPAMAHHNHCFRAFNMSRELAAHRYALAERPKPPGAPWQELVTRLAAETLPPPAPPAPPPDLSDGGSDAGTD